MKDYNVPFFANTPDDTHCFQAALKMVLKYFWPDREFSWSELDDITAKQDGMWTWPMAGLCWLQEHSFTVVNIEDFNYELFTKKKEQYLVDRFGKEIAGEQIRHSIIDQEISWAYRFKEEVLTEQRLPSLNDIKSYLDQDYLLIANINARSLINKKGYVGHFVVIKGYKSNSLIIHDPGLEPRENIEVPVEQFKKGWDYPDKNARNLICITIG